MNTTVGKDRITLVTKLGFDAVSDPVMGSITDRTKSRFGRRRPYFIFGVPLIFSALLFLFTFVAMDIVLSLVIYFRAPRKTAALTSPDAKNHHGVWVCILQPPSKGGFFDLPFMTYYLRLQENTPYILGALVIVQMCGIPAYFAIGKKWGKTVAYSVSGILWVASRIASEIGIARSRGTKKGRFNTN